VTPARRFVFYENSLTRRANQGYTAIIAEASRPKDGRWLTRVRNMWRSLHGDHSEEDPNQPASQLAAANGGTVARVS
jgi:hypothetical protein